MSENINVVQDTPQQSCSQSHNQANDVSGGEKEKSPLTDHIECDENSHLADDLERQSGKSQPHDGANTQETVEEGKAEEAEDYKNMKMPDKGNHRFKHYLIMGSQFVEAKLEGWKKEAALLDEKYPGGAISKAFSHPSFIKMLSCGLSMEQAYRAICFDDIIKSELEAEQSRYAAALSSRIARPVENGITSTGGIYLKSGASAFSRSERARLAARVFNGEKIKL